MNLTAKIASITMYVLLLISVVYSALVMAGPMEADAATPSFLDSALNWTYIMIFGALVITLIFEIFNVIMNPANTKRTLLSTVGVVIVLVIAWSLADGTPLQIIGYEGSDNVPSMLKLTDAGVYIFYFMMLVTFVTIVITEVGRILK